MKKIIIYTQAYNAEQTLQRAIESVLNQSHADFTYHLVDNGSLDRTGDIIREYAKKDERIIQHTNRVNHIWEPGNSVFEIINKYDDNHIFCLLDADDELDKKFFEKMLLFMEKNKLDIAVCGNDFIDAKTNDLMGFRKLNDDLILVTPNEYSHNFTKYHQFIRTIWAKLFSFSVLRNYAIDEINRVSYGWDTYFVLEALHHANRVGILAESLHRYYISPKSVSYRFDEKRILSDRILFDVTHDFLVSKCGTVSSKNLNFLWHVYLNAIKDTLNVLINAQINILDKLTYILEVFQNRHTQELIKWSGAELQKKQLFSQVVSWMLSQDEVHSGSGFDVVVDILAAMDIYPTKINGWQDGEVFILLTKIRDRQVERGLLSHVDSHIISVAGKSAYLVGSDAGFLCYFRDIVYFILQNNEEKSLSHITELIAEGKEIPDEYAEPLLLLALNLSAKLEMHEYFIYFKKIQISLLIELSRINEAIKEFADWDEILPDDMDFKKLKEKLGI